MNTTNQDLHIYIRLDNFNKTKSKLSKAFSSNNGKIICKIINNNFLSFVDIFDHAVNTYDEDLFNIWFGCLELAITYDKTDNIISALSPHISNIIKILFDAFNKTTHNTIIFIGGYTSCIMKIIRMNYKILSLTQFTALPQIVLNYLTTFDDNNGCTSVNSTLCSEFIIYIYCDNDGNNINKDTTCEEMRKFTDVFDSGDFDSIKYIDELRQALVYYTVINAIEQNTEFYIDCLKVIINKKCYSKLVVQYISKFDNIAKVMNQIIVQNPSLISKNLIEILSYNALTPCGRCNIDEINNLINFLFDKYKKIIAKYNEQISEKTIKNTITINKYRNDKLEKYFLSFLNLLQYVSKHLEFEEFYMQSDSMYLFVIYDCEMLFNAFLQIKPTTFKTPYSKIKNILINDKWCTKHKISILRLINDEVEQCFDHVVLNKYMPKISSKRKENINQFINNLINDQPTYDITIKTMRQIIKYSNTKYYDRILIILESFLKHCEIKDYKTIISTCIKYKFDIRFIFTNNYSSINVKIDNNSNLVNPIQILQEMSQIIKSNSNIRFNSNTTSGQGFTKGIIQNLLDYILKTLTGNKSCNKLNYNLINEPFMQYYGMLTAICLIMDIPIKVPKELLKYIYMNELNINDVLDKKSIDHINSLVTLSEDELSNMELTSLIPTSTNGSYSYNIFKITDSYTTQVTTANITNYINCLKNYYCLKYDDSPRYINFNSFHYGFRLTLINTILKHFLRSAALLTFVRGTMDIINTTNIDKHLIFKINTTSDITFDTFQILFLEYLQSLKPRKFSKFIEFATGTKYVYCESFGNVQYITVSVTANNNGLPIASTCSKLITIPCYESRKKLHSKMNLALNNCKTFQLA